MAGAILERELTAARRGRIRFANATRADDPDIRRLLRDSFMPGRISISLEREPDYFADHDLPGETKQTIVAREGRDLVCAGSCVVRRRFVNGEPRRVGYLGGLRLAAPHAGRFDIVRRGYEFFHQLQLDAPADYYFTSIAAGNERARRFLERGLPGMPRYEFVGEFVTVLLPATGRIGIRLTPSEAESPTTKLEENLAFINSHNRRYQLAPDWSLAEVKALKPLGLCADDFRLVHDHGRRAACAALWDQRVFRQTVIRRYSPGLRLSRLALNLGAYCAGRPRLPAPGNQVAGAVVSFLAAAHDDKDSLLSAVTELCVLAGQRGLKVLMLGFAADDPRLSVIQRRFRGHEYRSRLYLVHWPDLGGAAHDLDARLLAPEVGLL